MITTSLNSNGIQRALDDEYESSESEDHDSDDDPGFCLPKEHSDSSDSSSVASTLIV